MNSLLEIDTLGIEFDGFKALSDFSLTMNGKGIICIIGPNGAGKTTLLNLLTGKTKPTKGSIRFNGQDISKMHEHQIARLGIGRKFQTPNIFSKLTVYENIEIAISSKTLLGTFYIKGKFLEKIREILKTINLENLAYAMAEHLSHGQKQWLEIGMLLAQNPKLLLLDEPVTGMTHLEIEKTAELINLLSINHGIILIEHDMNFVRSIATDIVVMHQGEKLFRGTMGEVQNNTSVRQVYLGDGAYALH